MDTQFAIDAAHFFNVPVHPLPTPCKVKGFDGKSTTEIAYAIILHLLVDGRRFLNMPILITDLGQHDMIIGKNWLAEHDVWLNMKDQQLVWPDQRSLLDGVCSQQNMVLPKMILKRLEVNPDHQKNMERRDRLIVAEEKGTPRYRPPRTEKMDHRDNLAKMTRELLKTENSKHTISKIKSPSLGETMLQIDIAMIGAAGFHRHSRKKDTEIFITHLYEIDRIIEEKTEIISDPEAELITKKLPACYSDYRDVFSKSASDTLPPSRPCDHKIELESNTFPRKSIGYSPLYKLSAEELEAARKYIIENLNKGFIIPSNTPFASPILMAKKPGVDYDFVWTIEN